LPSSKFWHRHQSGQQQQQQQQPPQVVFRGSDTMDLLMEGGGCTGGCQHSYPDDVLFAIEGAAFIAEHLKDEDEGANVSKRGVLGDRCLDKL
jgi:hypothetical protein